MMRNLKLVFAIAFLAAFPLAFLLTRYMEAAHIFDSVGLWYTLSVSTFFAMAVAGGIVLGFRLMAYFHSRRLRATRQ
jgi:uncharacterized membrane protein (DUF2068 family)